MFLLTIMQPDIQLLLYLPELKIRVLPRLWTWKWNDTAPVHDVLRDCEFLAKKSITKMCRPPYSPDLALCDFFNLSETKKVPTQKG
jgi:hypothetical protein